MGLRLHKALASFSILICILAAPLASSQGIANSPTRDRSRIQDAAQSIAAGDLRRADAELENVLKSAPDDFRALNLLGIVRAQQQREGDAEKLFKRAIELKPDFVSAHVSLGMLYVQVAKPEEAIPQFQEALRLDAGREDARSLLVKVWRDQAHAAMQQGDPEKALAVLIDARKATPKDADVLYEFGMVALRMSLYPDAVQAFKEALEQRKTDGNTLYALGRAQMATSNYEDARATFEHYTQLQAEDASGHYALGMTLAALQRSAEAMGEFEKSIDLRPTQTESYFQLGRIALETGDMEAAERQFAKVLNRYPHHAGALAGMGRVKFQRKDYDQAIDCLQSAITADSSLREAHYYLGLTYARLNRKDDSEKELAIAARLEHEELERHQNLIRIIDPDQMPTEEPK